MDGLKEAVRTLLDDIQQSMFQNALKFREDNSHTVDTDDQFKTVLNEQGGFLYAHWCGSDDCEQAVQDETKATIRCIPFAQEEEAGNCIYCGN